MNAHNYNKPDNGSPDLRIVASIAPGHTDRLRAQNGARVLHAVLLVVGLTMLCAATEFYRRAFDLHQETIFWTGVASGGFVTGAVLSLIAAGLFFRTARTDEYRD